MKEEPLPIRIIYNLTDTALTRATEDPLTLIWILNSLIDLSLKLMPVTPWESKYPAPRVIFDKFPGLFKR